MPKCRRKTKTSKQTATTVDPRLLKPDYWEARLKRAGLSMEAGRSARISYGFTTSELDFDGRNVVRPEPITQERGEGLEYEWPVSL